MRSDRLIPMFAFAMCAATAHAQVVVPVQPGAPAVAAASDTTTCPPLGPTPGERTVKIRIDDPIGARLVVRLEDPPRTRVTLSIDNDKGNHYELVWDPAINDGLQHEVLLPHDTWRLTPTAEQERVMSRDIVHTYGTAFAYGIPGQPTPVANGLSVVYPKSVQSTRKTDIVFVGVNSVLVSPDTAGKGDQQALGSPALIAFCSGPLLKLSEVHLDKRKVVAAATARGLLDATAPKAVVDTLSLLTEVAMERAKAGAMELVKEKIITPLCRDLNLSKFKLGSQTDLVLPRTCALLQQLRLEDALGSGNALLKTIEDDVRELLPEVVSRIVDLDEQSKSFIKLALRFASRMGDGHADGIVEIDYLVALIDQMPWSAGFDRSSNLVRKWLEDLDSDPAKAQKGLQRIVMANALPEDFDATDKQKNYPWAGVPDCRYSGEVESFTGTKRYTRANRAACVTALLKKDWFTTANNGRTWLEQAVEAKLFTVPQVVAAISGDPSSVQPFSHWFSGTWIPSLKAKISSTATVSDALTQVNADVERLGNDKRLVEASCAVRLVLGAAKWCSSREQCTAGEIASVLLQPEKTFAASKELPEALCWESPTKYRRPVDLQKYIDLGVRLVAFLKPPGAGQERMRMMAMTRWMFDAVLVFGGDGKLVSHIREIASRLDEGDHINALVAVFAIGKILKCGKAIECSMPLEATHAAELLGAVASYAQVYRETKSLDSAEARLTRKKALESLIDAATDRRERGHDRVLSLGANVGFSMVWSDEVDRWDSKDEREFGLRVPLGLSYQFLPFGSPRDDEERLLVRRSRYFGGHLGLQLFDLGQFIRTGDEDVTWSSFVAPGIEAGVLLGEPNRLFTLTAHASFVPSLVDDGRAMWRYGFSIGYYVPFFDLN